MAEMMQQQKAKLKPAKKGDGAKLEAKQAKEARASMTGIKPGSRARVVTCSEPLSLFAHEFDFSSLRSRRTWLVAEGSLLRIGEYILDQEKIEKREHEMCAPLRRGLVGAGRPPGGTPDVKETAQDLERTDSPRFQNDRPGRPRTTVRPALPLRRGLVRPAVPRRLRDHPEECRRERRSQRLLQSERTEGGRRTPSCT